MNSQQHIAAINGETPDLILLEIGRNKLESGDTKAILQRLRQLTGDRETVMSGKGRLCVMVGGYDNDPRALPQIAAYGNYMRALMDEWPYFGWFSTMNEDFPVELIGAMDAAEQPDSSFMNIILANGCATVDTMNMHNIAAEVSREGWSPIELKRDRLTANVKRLFDGLLVLGAQHTLPMDIVSQRMKAIEQILQDRGII